MFDYWDWKCAYCGVDLKPSNRWPAGNKTATLDHIMPLSIGGRDTLDNVVACCGKCNLAKGNDHPDDAFL